MFESATYLALEAGEEVAHRFATAAEKVFRDLAERPGLGSPRWQWVHPQLVGLRSRPIPGFENWLVFYFPIDDGVEIVRVLHGAQDLEDKLASEEGR